MLETDRKPQTLSRHLPTPFTCLSWHSPAVAPHGRITHQLLLQLFWVFL